MTNTLRSRTPLIVIVEDDAALRQILELVCIENGYRVMAAAAIQDAMEMVNRCGLETVELVISDIYLSERKPNPDGYWLYEQWSAQRPTMPYLLISAAADAKDLPDVASGAVTLLMKPFDLETLLSHIKSLLVGERAY